MSVPMLRDGPRDETDHWYFDFEQFAICVRIRYSYQIISAAVLGLLRNTLLLGY